MKISLQYLLNKKHTTLKKFCDINVLATYLELVAYCEAKNLAPVSREEFERSFPQKTTVEKPKSVAEPKLESKPQPKPKPRVRKTKSAPVTTKKKQSSKK
jgi:hypothetical protein